MSALTTQLPPRAAKTDDLIFRLTVATYQSMIASGELTSDDPVELVEGVLIFKMPTDEIHNAVVRVLNRLLLPLTDAHGLVYRNQETVTLADGEPQPDGAIVLGPDFRYAHLKRKPQGDEIFWIAEVANTTLKTDRGSKLRSYARAAIATYWIVNLDDRVVEVYSDPDAENAEPIYRTMTPYSVGQKIPVIVQGKSIGELGVESLLP